MNRFASLAFIGLLVAACAPYASPPRQTWAEYLRGASVGDMTDEARVAKRPVYMGAGGRLLSQAVTTPAATEYGDKAAADNAIATSYMANLEYALYDALRKPGISVQRAGTEVVVILVRDAIIAPDRGEISENGADTLGIIAKILNKYDASFIEIAGYTDAMRDGAAAHSFSSDMAMRTGVYLARAKVNTARMFIVGRGSARPIAAQDDIGRLTNRRIELRIVPAR